MARNFTSQQLVSCVLRVRVSLYCPVLLWRGSAGSRARVCGVITTATYVSICQPLFMNTVLESLVWWVWSVHDERPVSLDYLLELLYLLMWAWSRGLVYLLMWGTFMTSQLTDCANLQAAEDTRGRTNLTPLSGYRTARKMLNNVNRCTFGRGWPLPPLRKEGI